MKGFESILTKSYQSYHSWLAERFSLTACSRSVYQIVDSYSKGPENAFDNFYLLFKEFSEETRVDFDAPDVKPRRVINLSLLDLLRSIRERPELYVVYPHFYGACAYLQGYEQAGVDLKEPKTGDELFYSHFKEWIEKEKFRGGLPRPWFKKIQFYSTHDSGTTRSSAYSLFFNLLDEYVELRS